VSKLIVTAIVLVTPLKNVVGQIVCHFMATSLETFRCFQFLKFRRLDCPETGSILDVVLTITRPRELFHGKLSPTPTQQYRIVSRNAPNMDIHLLV
jgi:hypothetical protein